MNGAEVLIGIATIAAIIAGPIFALRIQRELDERREIKGRKLGIFRTLMSFRATKLAPVFVQALNLIDIEFTSASEKPVRDAWKELQDHYSDMGRKTPKQSELDQKTDNEKINDLLAELLVKMGGTLGYSFDKVYIKKGAYYPMGLSDILFNTVEEAKNAAREPLSSG
jgi:hypothetical protein